MPALTTPANYQDIDGILWGWQWSLNTGYGHTVLSYAFPANASSYNYGTFLFDMAQFNAQQQAAGHAAIANVDAVSNLDFVFTTDEVNANIRYATVRLLSLNNAGYIDSGGGVQHQPGNSGTAEGEPPDPARIPAYAQGDIWFYNGDDAYDAPMKGNYAYLTITHELGHALGLKHGHTTMDVYSAGQAFLYSLPKLPASHDGLEFSVMTYRSYPGAEVTAFNSDSDFPQTLMQNDIFALQWMYGPNYAFNSGNTLYKWSPTTGETFVNGVGQGVTFHHKIFLTIWDGGGIDTYDFSNYTTAVAANLNPGAWSTPSKSQLADLDASHPGQHMARGSIANALVFANDLHGYIENAKGGSNNDVLIGNALSNQLTGNGGNDTLDGRGGADVLIGGAGNDTYIIDSTTDRIVEQASGGTDTVKASFALKSLPANVENVAFAGTAAFNFTGNSAANTLTGNSGNNTLKGGAGNDRLNGGAGKDILIGGLGHDTLTGGDAHDLFVINSVKETGRTRSTDDVITDFQHGTDDIDLHAIDASKLISGNNKFVWRGAATSFSSSKAGELRYEKFNNPGNDRDYMIVYGDTDGDKAAEFQIEIKGLKTLTSGDFIL